MIIVSDTSPISNLLKIHRVDILHELYGELIIPPTVKNELLALKAKNADVLFIEKETWIKSFPPKLILDAKDVYPPLHKGEIEAISLAKELTADWLLIDEKAGRVFAKQLGVKTIGLIGVLIEAKKNKQISAVLPLVDELIKVGGFWINDTFYKEITEITNE